MNILLIGLILSVVILGLVSWISSRPRGRQMIALANVAEGTHEGSITKRADAALAVPYLLVKHGSDGNHIAACGASDIPFGVAQEDPAAAEDPLTVEILGLSKRSLLMVASEAITVGEAVFTAASGKVQNLPVAAGTYYQVGYAMTAAGADGDTVEVQHHAPIARVVT